MISSSATASQRVRTSDAEMERILSKLLELLQTDVDAVGCKHCSWILAKVFEKEGDLLE